MTLFSPSAECTPITSVVPSVCQSRYLPQFPLYPYHLLTSVDICIHASSYPVLFIRRVSGWAYVTYCRNVACIGSTSIDRSRYPVAISLIVAQLTYSLTIHVTFMRLNCRWFMHYQHVDPDEAWKIHNDVSAYNSIGVHWGTFKLSREVCVSAWYSRV